MKNFILYFWQLPQNLLALCILFLFRNKAKKEVYTFYPSSGIDKSDEQKSITVWNIPGWKNGVSLGNYILLDLTVYGATTIKHENGHQKQSLILGPLYLFTVGFVSAVCNNLWDRLFHKKWDSKKRINWYYSRWPENWADKLGGVKRN